MRNVVVDLLKDTKPHRVIEVFTESSMLNDWWRVEKTLIQKHVGGLYTLAWNIKKNGIGYVSNVTIRKIKPNELGVENFIYLYPERQFFGSMWLLINASDFNGMAKVYLCQGGYQKGDD